MSSKKRFVGFKPRTAPAPQEPKKDGSLFHAAKRMRQELAKLYEKGRRLGFYGKKLDSFVQQNQGN